MSLKLLVDTIKKQLLNKFQYNQSRLVERSPGSAAGLWFRSQYLKEAQVSIISDDVCRQEDYYGNLITNNMFCAGWPDWSRDACQVIRKGSALEHTGQVPVMLFSPVGGLWRAAGV